VYLFAGGDHLDVRVLEPAGVVAVGRVEALPVAARAHDGRVVAVDVPDGARVRKALRREEKKEDVSLNIYLC